MNELMTKVGIELLGQLKIQVIKLIRYHLFRFVKHVLAPQKDFGMPKITIFSEDSPSSGSVHWVKCIPFTSPMPGAQYIVLKRVSLKNEQFLLLLLLRHKKPGQQYLERKELSEIR